MGVIWHQLLSFLVCELQGSVYTTPMKLLFNNLSIVWNIKILLRTFFVRRVQRCCVQSLVQIGEIAWEEFEKVGL